MFSLYLSGVSVFFVVILFIKIFTDANKYKILTAKVTNVERQYIDVITILKERENQLYLLNQQIEYQRELILKFEK